MARDLSFRDIQVRSSEIGIRRIGLKDLWQSLKEGYADFNASPTSAVSSLRWQSQLSPFRCSWTSRRVLRLRSPFRFAQWPPI